MNTGWFWFKGAFTFPSARRLGEQRFARAGTPPRTKKLLRSGDREDMGAHVAGVYTSHMSLVSVLHICRRCPHRATLNPSTRKEVQGEDTLHQ